MKRITHQPSSTTTTTTSFIILFICLQIVNVVDSFVVIGNSKQSQIINHVSTPASAALASAAVGRPAKINMAFTKRLPLFAKKKEEEEEYEYVEEEVDDDDEWEYEYEEEEEEYEDEEDMEEEDVPTTTAAKKKKIVYDESYNVPLEDDPDDPLYMAQKKAIEESIGARSALNDAKGMMMPSSDPSDTTSADFLKQNMEEFLNDKLQEAGIDMSTVEDNLAKFEMDISDVDGAIQAQKETKSGMDHTERAAVFLRNLGSGSDAFPPDDDTIYQTGEGGETMGVKNKDLVRLQNALEDLVETIGGYTDGSTVTNKQAMIRPNHELDKLDYETLDEINMCLNASATNANGQEYAETIKNEDPLRWLLYDLDFNVTNLMLASCKHNPTAPLILNHWMPQLCAYSRYADVRENDFHFTWADTENADIDELKRYFNGLGYDNIPTFTPKETNIVDVETEYDQEDITMSAFENWMDEVYSDENEDLYFDDEDFQPEHNVFDFDFGLEDSATVTGFKTEFDDFNKEHSNETKAWREQYAKSQDYKIVEDKEATEAFRGHLVIACCGSDHDLELAEKITLRMKDQFGKQVYVETRVYNHARQEDNVYEIWIESYDIQLIHSRRGAFYNANQWDGPADVDDKQLDFIVDKVGHLISDDSRYSYHIHEFFTLA